ncbi:MAG TPA: hypothetical protein VIA06_08655 [Candidatus Dormibacteraeota bacterium]|jgi:hypothetical protein|nr:hypothetical protein [Candidatus Dormibacteraeota bacterium]
MQLRPSTHHAGALLGLALSALIGAMVFSSSTADAAPMSPSAVASWKSTHDTDPHLALPAAELTQLDQRQQAASSWHQVLVAGARSDAADATPAATSSDIVANQQGQINGYYCGPAAVSEALGALGVSLTQSSAGSLLQTTADEGTSWSGLDINVPKTTGYPVADLINYESGGWYAPVSVPYQPAAGDDTTYVNDLTYDIDHKWPLVGDAWEVPNGPHLVGHPNIEIFHWFEIRGYENAGSTTDYEDSATTVWSGIPPYSSLSSQTIVTIVGGRGYVW